MSAPRSTGHIDTDHPAVRPVLKVLKQQQTAHFFLQRKFNLLLFGAVFLVGIIAILFTEAKIENHMQANLLKSIMTDHQEHIGAMHAVAE